MSSLSALPITAATLKRWPLPQPDPAGDKEDRGSVLVIAGSREIPGAAVLAGVAAMRAGAGKLSMAVPEAIRDTVAMAVPEARVLGLPELEQAVALPSALAQVIDRSAAILIGPGMHDERATLRLSQAVLDRVRHQSVVIDALALTVLHEGPELPWLLATPHAGEMAHLTGYAKEAICSDPAAYACEAAARWRVCMALKGPTTWIAVAPASAADLSTEGPSLWRFDGGTPSLATSGSGDVLAGLAVGLAARGLPVVAVAAWSTFAHAACGHRLERIHGGVGYLARELLTQIPRVLHRPFPSPNG